MKRAIACAMFWQSAFSAMYHNKAKNCYANTEQKVINVIILFDQNEQQQYLIDRD
jgi:hypothetical protein